MKNPEYSTPRRPNPASAPNLYDLLNAVLGSRDVVMVGDWNEQETDFERPPIYLIHGDVVATFEERSWGEIVDQFGAVDLIPGTIHAVDTTVLA